MRWPRHVDYRDEYTPKVEEKPSSKWSSLVMKYGRSNMWDSPYKYQVQRTEIHNYILSNYKTCRVLGEFKTQKATLLAIKMLGENP